MKQWARRTAALKSELAELANVRGPRWWLVAAGAALDWRAAGTYVASDAEPSGDTFMGYAEPPPDDPLADALIRAHAARSALRELDGQLPDQRLAVTVQRSATAAGAGAMTVPSALDVVAFAIGDRVVTHRLAARLEDETGAFTPADDTVPFATISLGDEPLATARHGHRRSWRTNGSATATGPWLGLGRAGGLSIVSTCHMIVDGYGHAWLTARIADIVRTSHAHHDDGLETASALHAAGPSPREISESKLPPVSGAIALEIAYRTLASPAPRALAISYALGRLLYRLAGDRDAPFSPTFQIPVAPGELGDPLRMRRRVVPAIASVRFEAGEPESFERFAARTKALLAREALGEGVAARLLSAARALPVPLAWKRQAVGPERPGWLEPIANVIGGRGCVSKIRIDQPAPPLVAVSSPSRLASEYDELGSCVVTVVDDGERAAITWCGSGRAGEAELLDELLALLPA